MVDVGALDILRSSLTVLLAFTSSPTSGGSFVGAASCAAILPSSLSAHGPHNASADSALNTGSFKYIYLFTS